MRSLTQARIMRAKKCDDATLTAAQGCINFQFRKTARSLSHFYDAALRPAGIRSTQFTMLVVIGAAQPVSMSDLANHLVMDRSTLTRNFGLLEQRGLVSTKVGKDRRSRLVTLTRKGRSALARSPIGRRLSSMSSAESAARKCRLWWTPLRAWGA
jgi:DNA-binding MarR family transcriptional regulator